MNSISKRHHYIPVFFLKQFANKDGKLWVYNKVMDRIERKPKAPKSIFFEWIGIQPILAIISMIGLN